MVFGSMLYWARITSDGCTPAEEEFALKCVAHSFVCWQSPEYNNGAWEVVDLISDTGIQDWPDDYELAPTFVYRMWAGLRGVLNLAVLAQDTSWSTIKSLY
jgi:hypothetical protein